MADRAWQRQVGGRGEGWGGVGVVVVVAMGWGVEKFVMNAIDIVSPNS